MGAPEDGYGAMPEVDADFPWRIIGDIRRHHAESRAFALVIDGWSDRSVWVSAEGLGDEARMVPDGTRERPVVVRAQSPCTESRVPIALAVTEFLDREPETVLAGMGIAAPNPVLAPPEAIRARLDEHDRDGERGQGERAALRWLVGEDDRRPGSGRPWAGGEPAPWQASAEQDVAHARRARGEAPEWLAGVAAQLGAVIGIAGPLQPSLAERGWLARRLHPDGRLPEHTDNPFCLCHIRRGDRFRSWEVIGREGLLGVVLPEGRRRWVATVDGEPLSGRVHREVSGAAYEIVLDAYRTGRAASLSTEPRRR